MRISRFFCPDLNVSDKHFTLPEAAHRHAVQVLRLKKGAAISVFDGQGLEYEATLDSVAKRESTAVLGEKIENRYESPLNITLLQGISRGERMDYALQKAVELGVNRVVPVISARCNVQLSNGRAEKRLAHWRGVMISACEQSGRSVLPELNAVMPLDAALQNHKALSCLVLDPLAKNGFSSLEKQQDVALLIGPEGGLSEQEIVMVTEQGYQAVSFGPRILRTETASVAAIAVMQTLWGDLG
ncbi:16S rRNA (uracil(1498)-N(3))-methyltransferase [Methylophaga sp. 42_25_T18]|nr:16S rRNA (uracil(1498)-N(3))-methyltransferase [Methylophaga sp. 42_25_T18]OUR88915.1 16S rRNA (uracil(1498)-N(3))-methyltransferase [Methylophaga sp. 42_8_T64]